MPIYECQTCKKQFKQKCDYDRHLKRIKPCSPKTSGDLSTSPKLVKLLDINIPDPLMCNYCKRIFARKDILNRHLVDRCKVKKSMDETKEQLFQKLLAEHEEFAKQLNIQSERIKALETENKEYKQIIGTQNNTQTNIQTQNINIKLVAYGKEDLSSISDQTYMQLINKGFMSVPALVEKVHFDKNKPENQNIYIPNMRDDYVLVYDGEDWKLCDKTDAINTLYDEKVYILDTKFQELFKKLPETAISKFKRFLDKSENDETKNGIKKELKLMLYNHRKLVKETRKLVTQQ
jgi:hypothetical protein